MTSTFDEAAHPRESDGKFATKVASEADGVDLDVAGPVGVPLAKSDIEVIDENIGCFENGYDEDDAAWVLGKLSGNLRAIWEYRDADGYGGDSEFIGKDESGVWRPIHPDVWQALSDPNSDVDLAKVESLLDPNQMYGRQDVDDLGDQTNVTGDDQTVCRFPGCDEDGEGDDAEDGLCGHHADVRYGHIDEDYDGDAEDGHIDGERNDECSKCAAID